MLHNVCTRPTGSSPSRLAIDLSPLGGQRTDYLNRLPCVRGAGKPVWFTRAALALCVLFAVLAAARGRSEASPPRGISSVSVSRAFFNPGLGQRVEISFLVKEAGSLDLSVVDRHKGLVRRLASGAPIEAGRVSYVWDGRGDAGQVVPDEAYSVRIDLAGRSGKQTYAPAGRKSKPVSATTTFYDRQNGILAYRLSAPSRVFIQGRSLRASRTIVNGEPRIAGSVIDHWNGYDVSGEVYIPALPGFSISISAVALPENAIITVGTARPALAASGGRPR